MPPGTPHFVITTEPTLSYGVHFYNPDTFLESFFSYIITFVAHSFTNVPSKGYNHLLRQFACKWIDDKHGILFLIHFFFAKILILILILGIFPNLDPKSQSDHQTIAAITCLIVFRHSLDPALTQNDYDSAEPSIHQADHVSQVASLQHFLLNIASQGFFGTNIFVEHDDDLRYSGFSELLYSFAQSFYLLHAYSDEEKVSKSFLKTHILVHHLISDLNCVDQDFGVKFQTWKDALSPSDISKSHNILPEVFSFSPFVISPDNLTFFPFTVL